MRNENKPNNLGLVGLFFAIYKTQKLVLRRTIKSIDVKLSEKSIVPLIKVEIPRTPKILNILEPTIFPKATLPSFLTNAATVTDSSGRDVPIAAKLIPMIDSGIP